VRCTGVLQALSLGVNLRGHETDCSPSFSAEFKNQWYIPLLTIYAFVKWTGTTLLYLQQGCTKHELQGSRVTKFCVTSVWNLLRFTLLASRILRWLLRYWKIGALLTNSVRFIAAIAAVNGNTMH